MLIFIFFKLLNFYRKYYKKTGVFWLTVYFGGRTEPQLSIHICRVQKSVTRVGNK